MRISSFLVLATSILAVFTAACGPITTVAHRPVMNVVAKEQVQGTFAIDVSSVPSEEHCSQAGGMRDLCVSGFQSAYQHGLSEVMKTHVRRGPGPSWVARFKLVEFTHTPAAVSAKGNAVAAHVHMRWQFEVVDETGKKVVAIARSTTGNAVISNPNNVGDAVRSLIQGTLEEVSEALDEQLSSAEPSTNP